MKTVIFDLDNTLYDAGQYYSGAFQQIAEYLFEKYNISKEKIFQKLMSVWIKNKSTYSFVLDDVVEEFGIDKIEINTLLTKFNNYSGKLIPYEDTVSVLNYLKKNNVRLGLISDGNPERQSRKLNLLGISDFFRIKIFPKEMGLDKSSMVPFKLFAEKANIPSKSCFYVADNPLIDFENAKKIGMNTVRILKGEFKELPGNEYIDFEIKNINNLLEILKI